MSFTSSSPVLGAPRAGFVAWVSFAVANSIAIEVVLAWLPWGRRLPIHLVDLGQLIAVGLLAMAVVALARRWGPSRRGPGLALIAVTALAIAALTIPEDLQRLVARLFGGSRVALVLITVTLALAVPAAAWLGRATCSSRWRWLAVAAAWLAALVNSFVLHAGYVHLHSLILVCAAALGGGALIEVPWPRASRPRLTSASYVLAGLVAVVAVGMAGRPEMVPLTNLGGAPQMKIVLRLRQLWKRRGAPATLAPGSEFAASEISWFRSREDLPSVAASRPSLVGEQAIVLLMTVDAFRGDLLTRPALAKQLPYFRSLEHESVQFTRVWAAAPGTAESLTSLFASKLASQMVWTSRVILRPHLDPSVRFPALLAAAKVDTLHLASLYPLTNALGIVRGFGTEVDLESQKDEQARFVLSDTQLPLLKKHLIERRSGPRFIYLHLLDPHAPYDDADDRPASSDFDHYLQELQVVGRRLADLEAWLRRERLASRTVLILSADHGEAFGEHGTKYHAKTMYEEQLRVPLWIKRMGIEGKGIEARRVDEPVSLLDIGPTVLDLMGVPTPGSFMGQSLVPFLRGESPRLTRPIAADNRRKRAMVSREGIKVIRDLSLGTLEIYDLRADPLEMNNLAASAPPRHARRLDAYFRAHLHPDYAHHPPLGP